MEEKLEAKIDERLKSQGKLRSLNDIVIVCDPLSVSSFSYDIELVVPHFKFSAQTFPLYKGTKDLMAYIKNFKMASCHMHTKGQKRRHVLQVICYNLIRNENKWFIKLHPKSVNIW